MKTTKRALFSSVVALILCFSMLVGTTFAWFTDTVESGMNTIVAGNLDVELYHGKEVAPVTNKVEAATNLFVDENGNPIKWEPGAVAYTNINVVNKGTLALKYQFSINFENENYIEDTNAKLSQVLKVAFLDEPVSGDREAVLYAAKPYGVLLSDLMKDGTLVAAANKVYGVVIYWEPSNDDNDFNVNNGKTTSDGKPLHIDLGVKLVATQVEGEFDSFDDDYDEDAWVDGWQVFNAQDLQSAINNGETEIVLMDDMELTESLVIPAPATTTYSRNAGVVINLNGKTICGNIAKDADAVIVNNGTVTIVGGTVKNDTVNGGYIIKNNGTLTLDGATIVGAPISDAGEYPDYAIYSSGNLTIEAGTNISSDRGALRLGGAGTTVINGGTFASNDIDRSLTSHVVYIESSATNTLTINGGTFKHLDPQTSGGAVINNSSKGTVYVNGGNFIGGNYYNESNLTTYGYAGSFSVTGGTFTAFKETFLAEGSKVVDNGDGTYTVAKGDIVVTNTDGLIAAINNADDGKTIILASGDYALRFTNNTGFNVDSLTFVGVGEVKLSLSSSEAWYGRIQGNNVTFENIHFTSTAGATGKATYNNCKFDSWAICASSNALETYFNNCAIAILNTSSDFNSGNVYVNNSVVTKAEYSFSSEDSVMYFEDCEIGELIPWNANTSLTNCTVTTLNASNMTTATLTIDGAIPVATTEELINAIKNAPAGKTTAIALTKSVYAGDINITLAAMGKQGGDVIIKAAKGVNPVITGKVTLGYRDQGVGAAMYEANITFDGITFEQATADTHSIDVQDVKSLMLVNCTIINNGEYGIGSARGNATGTSKIKNCTFKNAGMQLLGNYATGLVIDGCTFNNSRINVQAGNGVTIQDCEFNSTVTDANVGDSFYMIRSNSTPITVKNCTINVDSTVTGVAAAQAKWGILWNRGTTNWTVENVEITMTDAALAQTELLSTKTTSTGVINTNNLTVNGVQK